MTNFLKLSKKLINTKYIQHIDINPSEYIITLATNHNFSGIRFGWIGWINSSHQEKFYFHKDSETQEYKDDYILVDKWVKTIIIESNKDKENDN